MDNETVLIVPYENGTYRKVLGVDIRWEVTDANGAPYVKDGVTDTGNYVATLLPEKILKICPPEMLAALFAAYDADAEGE
jgi:hypothetical protein